MGVINLSGDFAAGLPCVGEAVGDGSGFDDLSVKGAPVDDGGAEARVAEGLRPTSAHQL
jgi:hypothetical protein